MTLHHRDEGRGEAVLLIHGLGACHRCFDELIASGKERFRFLAPDLPNSGQSKAWARTHPDELAQALLDFLTRQKVKRVRLFGHSFGALVALKLAALQPARVVSLTVASAPALGLPSDLKLALASPALDLATRWPPLWRASVRPFVRPYVSWLWGDASRMQPHHVAHYLETMESDGFVASMVEGLRSAAEFRLPAEALRRASLDPVVLWGEKDRLVSVVQGEQLASALGGRLRVLQDVGHLVPEESPQAVLDALDGAKFSRRPS